MYNIEKEKLLIIHMDDIGLDTAVNKAAIEIFEQGVATSASIMMPTPNAHDFIKWSMENPTYDIGIHITLTAEWDKIRWKTITSASEVPGLLSDDGNMWRDSQSLYRSAKIEEYEKETRAQIEKALELGLKPSHIDSHMGASLVSTEWFEIYMNIAREYNIIPGIPEWIMCNKDIDEMRKKAEIPIPKSVSCPGTDTYEEKKKEFLKEISEIPCGVNIYTVHPTHDTPYIRENVPVWMERYFEYKLLLDSDVKKALDNNEIRLVSWRDVFFQ